MPFTRGNIRSHSQGKPVQNPFINRMDLRDPSNVSQHSMPSGPHSTSSSQSPARHTPLGSLASPVQTPQNEGLYSPTSSRNNLPVTDIPESTTLPRTPVHRRFSRRTASILFNNPSTAAHARTPSPDSDRSSNLNLHNLQYVGPVNEFLICPICQEALVDPITTTCDHTFCKKCFDHAYGIAPLCPIDRQPLQMPRDIGPTHRLIHNQLDALEVKCPYNEYGCDKVLARSMVQNHVDKYCGEKLVECPKNKCEGLVRRKDVSRGCLHWLATCPDCTEVMQKVKMDVHRALRCEERKSNCDKCGVEFLRYLAEDHENECEEAIASCMWSIYGCTYRCKRKELADHKPLCEFKVMGPVIQGMKEEITALRGEVQFLNERDKAKDRRIRFLESNRSIESSSTIASGYPVPDMSGLPDSSPAAIDYPTYDSRDQYLLSLLESQESRVDQISAGMTELEAKQTMMLFNETIPIKDQLAELRSAQGVLGMHVRWLMNFRIQERRPGAGSGPANDAKSGSGSGSGGNGLQPTRRLSDTLGGNITKL